MGEMSICIARIQFNIVCIQYVKRNLHSQTRPCGDRETPPPGGRISGRVRESGGGNRCWAAALSDCLLEPADDRSGWLVLQIARGMVRRTLVVTTIAGDRP